MKDTIVKYVNDHANNHITHSVVGGGLTAFFTSVSSGDVYRTIILTSLGFAVTLVLSLIVKVFTKLINKK